MNRIIRYAIDRDTGYVFSQVGWEIALPIIDFADMGPADNFAMKAHLEAVPRHEVPHASLIWTKKIPVELKNVHRAFWGMRALRTQCAT